MSVTVAYLGPAGTFTEAALWEFAHRGHLTTPVTDTKTMLDDATRITPGISGPTVSPLALEEWVAVRAMVPRKDANWIMDQLAALGAQAILASEIRIARI